MHEKQIFFFERKINLKFLNFFWNFFREVLEKTGYVNTRSVSYCLNIQIWYYAKLVEKYARKSQFFQKIFEKQIWEFFFFIFIYNIIYINYVLLKHVGWAKLNPRKGVLISTRQFYFFGGLAEPSPDTWAMPTLARPKVNVNYLQNVNSSWHSACNWTGYRKWRLTEEQLTRSRSLAHDQEA
jgi:hypothetical protein